MKIMYLLYSFTTGGTERLVTDICNEMVRKGHEIHLYVVNDLYDQSMLDGLDKRVTIQLQKRKAGGGGKLKTLLTLAKYIRENRIDVIHCNSLDAPELLLFKPVAFPGARVVYTVHNMTGYRTLNKGKVIYRNLLCHRLIAISESVRQEMLRCGADSRKVVTVYNAIDLTRFEQGTDKAFDPSGPVIANVARIDSQMKGQDVLIRAAALLKDRYPELRCLFAGSADRAHSEDEKRLRQMVAELGLEKNARFFGNVEDIPGFLKQIDVFVLPSRSEGFGISLVEAMALGIPCVASGLDGPAEVLCGGERGMLFHTGDPQSLAEKLDQLFRSYDMHKATAVQNVAYVKENFDIRGMCDRLLKEYQ